MNISPVDSISGEPDPVRARLDAMSNDEVLAISLKWVNDQRKEFGLNPLTEFPKGRPGNSASCVLANALSDIHDESCLLPIQGDRNDQYGGEAWTGGFTFAHQGAAQQRRMPPEVAELGRRFDAGFYPHLVVAGFYPHLEA